MLFYHRPRTPAVQRLLEERERASFSYQDVGATRTAPPPGWRINHMRQLIGKRQAAYEKACTALFSWRLLAIDGLQVFPSTPVLEKGTDVAILSRHFGIWSVDFCRVIYVLRDEFEKDGRLLRTGFAYGTLPGHAIRGEEIFSIEWHPATREVWYDIYSFSLPASRLIKLLSPIARATQRRFARASLEAARLATESEA